MAISKERAQSQLDGILPDSEPGTEETGITKKPKKASAETKTSDYVTFSARLPKEVKSDWQAFCKAKKLTIGEATKEAFSDYKKSHKLTADEKKSYQKHYDSYMDS